MYICVYVFVWGTWGGSKASNIDCTGTFIVYMYAHLLLYVFTSILCSHLLFTRGLHCVTYCLFC